ncbi:unnamed protein product, partial [Mesorhabditis belari]|uniref:Elongation of very long chain fatty acids protein n=1 Tax=Mesorhabditis belari TaxID=2138241 RepID=A0AAF3J971_9BILA
MSTDVGFTDIFFGEWDVEKTKIYMSYFLPLTYKITIGYLLAIYFGQKLMKNRKEFKLDNTLTVWNFLFALFSGIAAYKLTPELAGVWKNHGFVASYCDNHDYYTDPSTGFWGWMFVMSKLPELGDTAFLVLRKRPVIFMHWAHHAITYVYAILTYSEMQAWARWSLVLNLIVHTIMYTYFGLRAMKIELPRPLAKFITTIQIVQFVISLWIFGHVIFMKYFNTRSCAASWNVLSLGGVMYLMYLYLFCEFFYKAYIKKRSPTKVTKAE